MLASCEGLGQLTTTGAATIFGTGLDTTFWDFFGVGAFLVFTGTLTRTVFVTV
jgi:hypothetical protein